MTGGRFIKEFTDREKEYIKNLMIENGKKAFSKAGIKKTSIEEITKSVGIAKGSFYTFFNSKEELYFQILMKEIRESIPIETAISNSNPVSSKQMLSNFLREAVSSMYTNSILKLMLIPEEFNLVRRKLATSDVSHPEADIILPLISIISKWQRDGIIINRDVNLLANVIRCLFLLTTHKEEIGDTYFKDVMDFLIDMIADKFIEATD